MNDDHYYLSPLGLTAHQDYFTHFEPSQLLGRAKMGDPQEKTPDNPQAELGLSHMWHVTRAKVEPTAVRRWAIQSAKD